MPFFYVIPMNHVACHVRYATHTHLHTLSCFIVQVHLDCVRLYNAFQKSQQTN